MAPLKLLKAPDHTTCFLRLSKIAMLVLLIPHSHAQEESAFYPWSKKIILHFQPCLDPNDTLSSIVTVKLANDMPDHQFEPSKQVFIKVVSRC